MRPSRELIREMGELVAESAQIRQASLLEHVYRSINAVSSPLREEARALVLKAGRRRAVQLIAKYIENPNCGEYYGEAPKEVSNDKDHTR